MATNINDLAAEINRALANYAHGVGEDIEKVAEKVAKEGAQQLKARSPVGATHRYAKGWRAKKVGNQWVVHNIHYQLTHLLEKGHAKVGGGRIPAVVHIAPVEQEMINEFVQGVEEAIRG
ncbi:HK97 gp10 family phage protein [Lysinibacillus sp. G4S2]|uniref:HK97 gp10 family phage protein n=1 Tax=Lysinibacillus sp. G4S2 TaxID=3055859 RepID=UPI0025A1EB37|nr:HK97 gp10 family phage protein [Lysinibacillus sp. G4S2]MDM5245759.1 HK97 gp10 family phage protein [Lysinibacillus sp. G4S2]